jgi:hypothetical protein
VYAIKRPAMIAPSQNASALPAIHLMPVAATKALPPA